MPIRLEHANLHVSNVDEMLRFIKAAFPAFKIRYDSGKNNPEHWVHIGSEDTYLAIYQATQKAISPATPYSGRPGINHLGFVVNDVKVIQQRLLKAGFEETTLQNNHPGRKRIYFYDAEGNDWEFIEYLSESSKLRNDYSDLQ
jgi:catechol 2,3-dioxygenase-like lactoylglutathione lyase family enzyme